MKTKRLGLATFVVALSFVLSACGPGQMFGPTLTPTLTNTPTPTNTPIPTNTPTATPIPLGQITGIIFIEGINHPYQTNVNLVDANLKAKIANVSTDSDGRFSFSEVKPGEYVLSINVPIPNPIFDSYHCKYTIGGEKGWEWSGDMKLVGSSFSISAVTYQSDLLIMQGETIEHDLTLVCK